MTAFLIVRAEVDPSVRDGFDAWYRDEHLPDAVREFSARRGLARLERSRRKRVHMAFYEFETLADVNRVMESDAIRDLIAEFDRNWQGKVTRTREAVESIQQI